MAELNKLNCSTDARNTGVGGCPLHFEATRGAFLVPANKVFTQTELAALQATLQAAILSAKGTRIYPIHKFEAITDNTEDPTFQTMASGRLVPIREGNYNWIFQYYDGGLCLSNKLRSFKNNTGYAALFYDAEYKLFGTQKTASDNKPGMAGVPLEVLYPFPWKVNDFSNAPIYRIQFSFKPNYINEDIAYVDAGFNLDELNGLQNITLTQSGASAAGVIKLIATVGCDGANIYDTYNGQLDVVGAWTAINTTTGAAIDIDTVVVDPAIKGFTITLDNADTDYPASGTGQVTINLASPSALDALDVSGYEGLPITVLRG